MNTWTSIKISAASCLIAIGQVNAGNIEKGGAEVSLTPATIFSQAPAAAKPVSLYSVESETRVEEPSLTAQSLQLNAISDSFDQSVLQRNDYSSEAAAIGAQPAVAATQPTREVATMNTAANAERKLTSRPAASAGSLFFLMIFKSIIVAGLIMGMKRMTETLNVPSQIGRTV